MLKLLKPLMIVALLGACACAAPDTRATGRTDTAASQPPTANTNSATPTPAPTANGPSEPAADSERSPASREPSPAYREVTIPAGTELPIVLDTAVASDTSRPEQPVHGHLARAIKVNGEPALPQGSRISGVVTEVVRAGRVKGRARLAMRFETVVPRGDDERYPVRATPVSRTAKATKEKDALKIAAPAAGGALVGRLLGGRKGALVGAGVGGGAGTAYVLSTRGEEVRLGPSAELRVKLLEPLTVKVRG